MCSWCVSNDDLQVGRGRAAWHLRPRVPPVLPPLNVERPRWNPEGAALRLDQQRGKARPSSRLDAIPLLQLPLVYHNSQGNHGEDVKELYYYLDSTPTHSYMRALYKYPQEAYPYQQLKDENARRGLLDEEYELIDTGVGVGGGG
jgi:hypothetical protein